jgi:hypothetical protein
VYATSEYYRTFPCYSLFPSRHASHLLSIYLSVYIYVYIYMSTAVQPFVGFWPLFSFLNFYTVGRTPWTGDQPFARALPAPRTPQTQNKHTLSIKYFSLYVSVLVRSIGECESQFHILRLFLSGQQSRLCGAPVQLPNSVSRLRYSDTP